MKLETALPPSLKEIKENKEALGVRVRETPVWEWESSIKDKLFGKSTQIFLKLEIFQYAGSFKPRGALTNMLTLNKDELERGVTAVSAGNHAIAVSYAANVRGVSAKVVMPKHASHIRVEKCKSLGAEVVLKDDVHKAFEEVYRIRDEEGRAFIHPFEGFNTALGTATLGYEFAQQVQDLDAVIVPIGGGGLCAGVSAAVKQAIPKSRVYGIEPAGANTMTLSFKSGKPESIDKVDTIADSLAAPHAAPYTFSLCNQFVDDIFLISDQDMCNAIALLFHEMKLGLEPAGAAATAGLIGPLNEKLRGKKVGIIVCGTNIATEDFCKFLKRGSEFFDSLL